MTTMGISLDPPLTDAAASEESAPAKDKKKPISLILIPVTISVGLLLGVGYVGARIVAARPPRPAPVVEVARKAPPPAEPVKTIEVPPPPQEVAASPVPVPQQAIAPPASEPTPKPAPPTISNAPLSLITPQAGDTYLQLAALPPRLAIKFVDELRRIDIAAHMAPGPAPDAVRILVGPFPDEAALNQAKTRIEATGLNTILRAY